MTKLELETWAGKSFDARKQAANEAGIVLRAPDGIDSGNYPDRIYNTLRHFRRVMALSKGEPKKVVTHMHRQLVSERDEKTGKPVTKEYLTWTGYYDVTDHRGVPYQASLDVGKYEKPKIGINPDRKYNPDTGLPIGAEKIFTGQKTVYTIPVPDKKEARKKLIDSIIGDNFPEEIHYYFKDLVSGRRDNSFSYEQFTELSIDELKHLSNKGAGAKGPGYFRDKDGNLRDKDDQIVSVSRGAQQ